MRQWYCAVLCGGMAAALLAGCSGQQAAPGTPQAPPGQKIATPDELLEVWDNLVKEPQERLNFQLGHVVAQDMANRHPEGIVPLLKRIDVETPSPQAITLTLAATRDLIKPEHEALLTELAGPNHGSYTRRVAIDLLGSIDSESVRQKMAELEKDPDLLISVAAYLAYLHRGDAEYVGRMRGYWENEKVHDASRQEMLRRLPDAYAIDVVDLLGQAVSRPDWPADVRQRVLGILSVFNDTRALEALKAAAETNPEPQLREFAQKAAAAMQARIDSGATGTTTTPAGETITSIPLEVQGTTQESTTLELTPEPQPAGEAGETQPAPVQ